VFHVAFDGLDEVRDQIMAASELHIDLREAVANAIALVDQSVVNADCPENDCGDNCQKNQE
jgi:hypothetical protein